MHNRSHEVHRILYPLNYVLLVARYVDLEYLEVGWETRLDSVCHVFKISNKLGANLQNLPQFFLAFTLEVYVLKRLLNAHLNGSP